MKFFILLSLVLYVIQVQHNGKIDVVIEGISKVEGQIIINLYNNAKGFPTKPNLSYKQYAVPIKNTKCELLIENLPYGEYAISAYQDANLNNKFDTNILGMPVEKVGVSNNPKALFIPYYDDAKFFLSGELVVKTIKIK